MSGIESEFAILRAPKLQFGANSHVKDANAVSDAINNAELSDIEESSMAGSMNELPEDLENDLSPHMATAPREKTTPRLKQSKTNLISKKVEFDMGQKSQRGASGKPDKRAEQKRFKKLQSMGTIIPGHKNKGSAKAKSVKIATS